MIYYQGYSVTMQEVPDEISLLIPIADCHGNCKGCHSPWLAKAEGGDLLSDYPALLEKYEGFVSCVCFMGQGNDWRTWKRILKYHRKKHPEIKTCLYSGEEDLPPAEVVSLLNYVKVGPYREECGGLNQSTTNQRFYSVAVDGKITNLTNLTHLFQKERKEQYEQLRGHF